MAIAVAAALLLYLAYRAIRSEGEKDSKRIKLHAL
jgi:hypothetical protein